MRLKAKIDSNQAEIVDALRDSGASVAITSQLGAGFPDLVVGLRGETFLLEVKTPTGKMTRDEMRFMDEWHGHYMVVRNAEQAIDAVTNPNARRCENALPELLVTHPTAKLDHAVFGTFAQLCNFLRDVDTVERVTAEDAADLVRVAELYFERLKQRKVTITTR